MATSAARSTHEAHCHMELLLIVVVFMLPLLTATALCAIATAMLWMKGYGGLAGWGMRATAAYVGFVVLTVLSPLAQEMAGLVLMVALALLLAANLMAAYGAELSTRPRWLTTPTTAYLYGLLGVAALLSASCVLAQEVEPIGMAAMWVIILIGFVGIQAAGPCFLLYEAVALSPKQGWDAFEVPDAR